MTINVITKRYTMFTSLRRLILLSCCLLSLPASADTREAQSCVTISDDGARLACYDRAMGRNVAQPPAAAERTEPATPVAEQTTTPVATRRAPEPAAQPGTPTAPAPSVSTVEPSQPAPAAPSQQPAAASEQPVVTEAEFGLPKEREKEAVENNRITASVVDVSKTPLGSLVVELDNAHVWQQVDRNRLSLRKGDEVMVREGMGGSFYMAKTSGSRSLKVRRIK